MPVNKTNGIARTHPRTASALRPFHATAFSVIWSATVVANIGTWMYSAATGWLMTTLSSDPLTVSLVQVAASLPIVLFALPAGAMADIFDKRLLLVAFEIMVTFVSVIFAFLVWSSEVTPVTLLVFTFLIGTCGALTAPAWQSIVPHLVPQSDLGAAIAANSVGINISRAIGPTVGGVLTASLGIAAPFWIDAVSNLGVIGALIWWRPARNTKRLQTEHLGSAVRIGLGHAWHNPNLRSTLWRTLGFALFASAYWALLPLVARNQLEGGPDLYGILLGGIGAGAIGGAFVLPRVKEMLGPDRLVQAASLGTSIALILFGCANNVQTALAASLIAGVSWIAALSTLNVSAQLALPEWVRGRGLSLYITVLFGALTLGSGLWGAVAASLNLTLAHLIAAAGAIIVVPLTLRWKLHAGTGADLTPSMHWPPPVTAYDVALDTGPVLVTVEYHIEPENRDKFLVELERVGNERRRDGAYRWGLFEDTGESGRFLETFLLSSWLEHLLQHERVTKTDRVAQDAAEEFQIKGPPVVTHLIAAIPHDRRAI